MWLQQSWLWGSQVVATIVIVGNSCGCCNHDTGKLWRQISCCNHDSGELWRKISCNDFMLMPFAAIIILGSLEWSRDNDFLLCHLFHQMLHLKLLLGNTSTGGVSIYRIHHHVSTQVGACTYHYTEKGCNFRVQMFLWNCHFVPVYFHTFFDDQIGCIFPSFKMQNLTMIINSPKIHWMCSDWLTHNRTLCLE